MKALFAAAVLTGLATTAVAAPICPAITEARDLSIVVPANVYPTTPTGLTVWSRLIKDAQIAKKAGIRFAVIVYPGINGDFSSADANYRNVIERLDAEGAILLGYVYTSDAKRPIANVKAAMANYGKFYPEIDGFFVDETVTSDANLPYYEEIRRTAVRNLGSAAIVMGNAPGNALTSPRFRDAFTVTVVYEDYAKNFVPFTQQSVVTPASPSQIAYLIHTGRGIRAANAQERACLVASELRYQDPVERNAGWWFFTTDIKTEGPDGKNPYDTLGTEHGRSWPRPAGSTR